MRQDFAAVISTIMFLRITDPDQNALKSWIRIRKKSFQIHSSPEKNSKIRG